MNKKQEEKLKELLFKRYLIQKDAIKYNAYLYQEQKDYKDYLKSLDYLKTKLETQQKNLKRVKEFDFGGDKKDKKQSEDINKQCIKILYKSVKEQEQRIIESENRITQISIFMDNLNEKEKDIEHEIIDIENEK